MVRNYRPVIEVGQGTRETHAFTLVDSNECLIRETTYRRLQIVWYVFCPGFDDCLLLPNDFLI